MSAGGGFAKTTNAGLNWEPTLIFDFIYRSVFFTNDNTGYSAGSAYNQVDLGIIVKTTNAGVNWFPLSLPTSAYQKRLITVYFPSVTTGYVVGGANSTEAVVLKTTNEGNTWVNQTIPYMPFF